MRKAVIDVGSNSLLLLAEENIGGRWQTIGDRSAVTALGEGTKSTGLLSERGIVDSLAALRSMFDEARGLGAETIVAAATMAARIARNTPDFQARAAEQGTPVTVLSGDDEARLGFQAVAEDPTFEKYDRLTIIDPGGQSTELVTAVRTTQPPTLNAQLQTLFRKSFAIGTLGLRGDLLASESPDYSAILTASATIDDTIGLCYLRGQAGCAVVLGATGTNLVSIRERLDTWEPERIHGAYLDFEEISKSVGWMMPMTDAERRAVPGMEPGREKTIHIGSLILERFLSTIGAPGCYVSVRGWRHAMLEHSI